LSETKICGPRGELVPCGWDGRGRKNLEEMQGRPRGGAGEQKSLPRNGAQGWEERERGGGGERREERESEASETDTWMDPIGPALLVSQQGK
jgi:hypothetical protein